MSNVLFINDLSIPENTCKSLFGTEILVMPESIDYRELNWFFHIRHANNVKMDSVQTNECTRVKVLSTLKGNSLDSNEIAAILGI